MDKTRRLFQSIQTQRESTLGREVSHPVVYLRSRWPMREWCKQRRQDAYPANRCPIPLLRGGMPTAGRTLIAEWLSSGLIISVRGRFSIQASFHSERHYLYASSFGFLRHTGLTATPTTLLSSSLESPNLRKASCLSMVAQHIIRAFTCAKTFWVGYSSAFNFSKIYQTIGHWTKTHTTHFLHTKNHLSKC